jgi:hypothetical protein
LNDLDSHIIRRCKRLFRLQHEPSQTIKNRRCRALERFVLVLSDQQMVTGVAIFVIGYSQHCSMSSYHFFIIVALGWFSSTTHLSTLTVLQNYFKEFPALKYIRLVGMTSTFVMLFIGMLVLYTKAPFRVPVQCRLARISLSGTHPLNYLCAVLLFFWLTVTFLSKSFRFCFQKEGGSSALLGIFQCLLHDKDKSVSRNDYCVLRLGEISQSTASSIFTYAQGYFAIFNFVYIEFLDSFMWQIVWLFFGNFYGVRQLVWARKFVRHRVPVQGNESELNFGQLLALSLLVLPLLAAVEAYYGRQRFRCFTVMADTHPG